LAIALFCLDCGICVLLVLFFLPSALLLGVVLLEGKAGEK